MLEFQKCHLFFRCGKMKSFLFLLFFLLLFGCPQGLTVSHKKSKRAVNTTLETSFNGTYEKRNPCTNEEIEKTSYVASHEFRHHAEENNLSDYTHKCSSIISSFLQALGNLVHFNHNQNGIFNFHINTSISQQQDGLCEPGKRTSCKTLPTITIEATGCELSPTLTDEQLRQNQKKEAIFKDLLNEEIRRGNQVSSKQTPRTFHFILNSSGNTPRRHPENKVSSVPSIDAFATESGAKLRKKENAWAVGDIFQPVIETDKALEPECPTTDTSTRTKNTPQKINDFSGNDQTRFQTEQYSDFFKPSIALTSELDSENNAFSEGTEPGELVDPEKLTTTAESFNEPFPSHSQYLSEMSYFGSTTSQPITDAEAFYSEQFSNVPFSDQQPITHSKQLFNDNLYMPEPDSEFSPNQQSDNSFIFKNQTPKAPLRPQKPISTETYQSKDMSVEVSPVMIGQNVESFQQSLQSGRQPENSNGKTEAWPETAISSETETLILPSRKDVTEYEEASFNQMVNSELPQVTPNEEQFMNYDGQTPTSGFSASYPVPSASMPPLRSTPENILADENSKEATKAKSMAIDYPDEFFKAQPELEDNLGSPTLNDAFSYKNDQGVSFSNNLPAFNTRKAVADPTSWALNERSQIEKPFDDVNENQFFSTTSSERLSFLTSESQKSEPYYSEESSDESSINNVTDTELPLPSEQYETTAKPESESLLNYSDQYGNVEEAKYTPESNLFDPPAQFDSELTTQKPYLQSYSPTQENQAGSFAPLGETASPLQYSTSTKKFSSSYDSASDESSDESFPPSGSDTFSNEYLTTLPPPQDSFENSQDLKAFNLNQDRSSFYKTTPPFAFEGKLGSTFPGQIFNENAMSFTPDVPSLSSKQSSNDIFTSTSTTDSFDDYQDSLYSKPNIELTLTTPMPHFNDNTYEPDTKPYFANDEDTYSDELWRTTPTIFGAGQLKQQSSSNRNSDPTLEQPLNNTSGSKFPVQNYETPKSQLPQLLENSPSDAKPFSDFSTESTQTDNFINYDSFVPQMNQYQEDNVLNSDQSEPNLDVTHYSSEGFPEENPVVFSPQSFSSRNDKDRSPFGTVKTSNLNPAADYFEPTTAYSYQKPDLPTKFFKDPDAKLEKFLPEIFTTTLPPFGSPSGGFSSSPNYKITSENSPTQNRIEESPTSSEQFVDGSLPPQFEEPVHAFPAPFTNVKKFDSDFQTDENLKQPFEPAITEEKPRKSSSPVYKSPKDQLFSYSDATEALTPYTEKKYVVADQPLTSDLSEYGSTTSNFQLTEEPAETELNNYRISATDDSGNLPVEGQQSRYTADQESTLNYSNQFSDFYPKEASVDFFPPTESPFISNSSDSPENQTELYLNNKQPSTVVFQPPSSVSAMGNDPSLTVEFRSSAPESQPESVLPFSDDKPSAIISGKTPLDISSPADSLVLTNYKELQSHDFRTPLFVPDNQSQKVTSFPDFHSEDFSKDSQSFSVKDFDSIASPKSHFVKPEIFRNTNRAPNRQTAAKFKTFQSPQRDLEIYDQFSSPAALQSQKFDEGEIVPSNDYVSTLKSASQIEPSVNDYNENIFNPYSEPNLAPKPQPYQYQPEFSTPTLLEEYSNNTPTPFDIESTTELPVSEVSFLKINDQNIQEKMSEPYVTPRRQLKSQPSYDSLPDILGGNVEEPIPSESQTSDFDLKPDKSEARGSYERNSAGNDNIQPMPEELDYLDESLNTNLDEPTPGLSNHAQSSVTSPSSNLVSNVQFRPNDLSFSPQPPSSSSFQLNNISNKPSQQSSAISFRYPQSEKDISSVTDKILPQSQLTTAAHNDEEMTKMPLISKPQPQMSLNFADQFSDDNIRKQLSDSPDQEFKITPAAVLPFEFEPVQSMNFPSSSTQRNPVGFSTSDNVTSNQPSLRSQTQQMDVMTDSTDQNQNDSDSKLSSEATVSSPPHTTATTESQREPSELNQKRVFNSQEQFSPYDQHESQPVVVFNNRPISTEYQQDSSIPPKVYDRFPSKTSLQEQRYFNEDLPYSEAQRLRASRYGEQDLNPREKFQPRPYTIRSSRYPVEGLLVNSDGKSLPSVASRHSATQKFDPQSYSMNFPNQYSRPNLPISNSYNNRPSPQRFTSNAMQAENSLRSSLPFSLDRYPKRSETEWSPDQTSKSVNSPSYNYYDQTLSSQLPNEKLSEYDDDFTPELAENSQVVQTPRHQDRETVEEDPREGSNDYLTEEDPPLGFNLKPDPYEFQDGSSPNNEPPSFMSPPAEKERHSNPLLQALESHLTFPFLDHLRPSASRASFAETNKKSLKDSFPFDSQNEFQNVSAIPTPSYSEGRDSELDFINYQQRPQSLNGIDAAQDVTNARQPDSFALVSDPNIPSNKAGEDYVSRPGQISTPLSCPFDPVHKGNMTAPSYYIVVSKSPVDEDEEEQFKVEKVYLGDGMPLDCTMSTGKTFPTSLYTPIPFAAAGTVKLRTKSDFA